MELTQAVQTAEALRNPCSLEASLRRTRSGRVLSRKDSSRVGCDPGESLLSTYSGTHHPMEFISMEAEARLALRSAERACRAKNLDEVVNAVSHALGVTVSQVDALLEEGRKVYQFVPALENALQSMIDGFTSKQASGFSKKAHELDFTFSRSPKGTIGHLGALVKTKLELFRLWLSLGCEELPNSRVTPRVLDHLTPRGDRNVNLLLPPPPSSG